MARKMLSAGARADARNNLVEIIETNCRVRWHVVPNWLQHSRTNRIHGSHPQIHQMERVPTVTTTGLRRISRTIHITQNLDWVEFPSANQNIHNDHVGGRCLYTFVQTARFVANLVAHVGRIELVRWVRRLIMRSRRHTPGLRTCSTKSFRYVNFIGTSDVSPGTEDTFHILLWHTAR